MNPGIIRIMAGAVLGYYVVKKLARKPLHRLAVATTKGALNMADKATAAGQTVTHGWQDIVEQAKADLAEKREHQTVQEAGAIVNKVSDTVSSYMHKTAETIDNLADRLERDKNEESDVEPDLED